MIFLYTVRTAKATPRSPNNNLITIHMSADHYLPNERKITQQQDMTNTGQQNSSINHPKENNEFNNRTINRTKVKVEASRSKVHTTNHSSKHDSLNRNIFHAFIKHSLQKCTGNYNFETKPLP